MIRLVQIALLLMFAACSATRPSLSELQHKSEYRIAFGSCVKSNPTEIWKYIKEKKPDIFFLLGDVVYLPARTLSTESLEYMYKTRYASKYSKPLMETVPSLAIWDDHDFDLNNADSTFGLHKNARDYFKSFWNNPAPPPQLFESVAFRLDLGEVLILATDNRTYRLNARTNATSQVFGKKQIAWLLKEISRSEHRVLVLAMGSQFLSHNKHSETFSDYESERAQLLAAISNFSGRVIILSGDRHYSEILEERQKSERGVKSIWELTSSPLNARTEKFKDIESDARRRGLYAQSPNFGILDIDLAKEKPRLKVRYYNQKGQKVLAVRLY